MSRCEDEQMWRWEDVKMRRCEDEKVWRWEDLKMRRCEDEQVWRWEDVREGVKMSRCEDEQMWRWADVKMRRCEDEKVWRWEGVKMRRWDTDPHYWKNPALRRSREKISMPTWAKKYDANVLPTNSTTPKSVNPNVTSLIQSYHFGGKIKHAH